MNPNAVCPVCGKVVFYYQSPNGGRVFFDDLGWPWPKHPCTDRANLKVVLLKLGDPRADNSAGPGTFDARLVRCEKYKKKLQIYAEILNRGHAKRIRILADWHYFPLIGWLKHFGIKYDSAFSGEMLFVDPYKLTPCTIQFTQR